jgi:hypothetical protein
MDGFYFLINEIDDLSSVDGNAQMSQLLFATELPFLIRKFSVLRSLNSFIVQRNSHRPISLPMAYKAMMPATEGYQIGSSVVAAFNADFPQTNWSNRDDGDRFFYSNSKDFYDYMMGLDVPNWRNCPISKQLADIKILEQ